MDNNSDPPPPPPPPPSHSIMEKFSRYFSKMKAGSKSSSHSSSLNSSLPLGNSSQSIQQIPMFEQLTAQIAMLKKSGNASYQKGQFKQAISDYDKAIKLCIDKDLEINETILRDWLSPLYSNRAASFLALRKYKEALLDATSAVSLRPDYYKARCRKADALLGLREVDEAIKEYEAIEKEFKESRMDTFTARKEKALSFREDEAMGIEIIQLQPGIDLGSKSIISPIQNAILDFALQMENCIYIIVDNLSRECVVVDACWDVEGIIKRLKEENLTLKGCIVTHAHFDHVGGSPPPPYDQFRIKVDGVATMLKKFPNIKVYLNAEEVELFKESNKGVPMDRVELTTDGYEIILGKETKLKLLHTPGHTKGSQCVFVNGKRIFTGDTLFCNSCGRVDFPESSKQDMKRSLDRLLSLPPTVVVYPGHRYDGEWTTIGREIVSERLFHLMQETLQ